MITIKNRNLFIPESEKNLGFYGDNLRKKVEFLITDSVYENAIFRLYLTFDNGLVNFLLLSKDESDSGLHLVWNVEQDHIYKSGVVTAQIKAFEGNNVIWHTISDTFVVSSSPEESLDLKHQNAEFLQYEKKLNELYRSVQDERTYLPYIGENGNWFLYDVETKAYKDSGVSSKIENPDIADGAVDTSKLADRSVTGMKIGLEEISDEHLVWKYLKTREELAYDETMLHNFLVQNSDELARPYEHIYYLLSKGADRLSIIGAGRCTGVFSSEDKFIITNIETQKSCVVSFNETEIVSVEVVKSQAGKMNTADTFYPVEVMGNNVDPEIIAYQTTDPTRNSMLRIPLSVIKGKNDFINAGNFASLSELKDYEFEYEKIYKLEIKSDIVTTNNITIDAGVYICRHYWSPPHIYDAYLIELIPFVPNGRSWALNLENGNGFLTDKLTDFATFKYVDSKIDNVNTQLSGINTQLEGLDELLASI